MFIERRRAKPEERSNPWRPCRSLCHTLPVEISFPRELHFLVYRISVAPIFEVFSQFINFFAVIFSSEIRYQIRVIFVYQILLFSQKSRQSWAWMLKCSHLETVIIPVVYYNSLFSSFTHIPSPNFLSLFYIFQI